MLVPQDPSDQERLKSWLVSILKPLCPADPDALAKYIMALVKKDKREGELKDSCLAQLKAFLEDNTEHFVHVLFTALKDKSYLVPVSNSIQRSSFRPNLKLIIPEGQDEPRTQADTPPIYFNAQSDQVNQNFGDRHPGDHQPRSRPYGRGMRSGRFTNRRHLPSDQSDKCTLEVRKLPHQLNTITKLNDFFSKFGTIVNLQVMYEGDPEAAVVQFSLHSEALAAHRSPEAVLGNRFIKLFWHNKDQAKPPLDKVTNGEDESENKRHIPKFYFEAEPTVAFDSIGTKPDDQDALDDVKGCSNGSKDVISSESFHLGHRGVLSQPNAIQLPTRQQLTKSNIAPPASFSSSNSPPSASLTSEVKKEKLQQKLEIKNKCQELLEQTSQDQAAVGQKLLNASKEERPKLKKLFDILDEKRKQLEDDLKKVTEDLLRETKNPLKRRKRPYTLDVVDDSSPPATSPSKKSAILPN